MATEAELSLSGVAAVKNVSTFPHIRFAPAGNRSTKTGWKPFDEQLGAVRQYCILGSGKSPAIRSCIPALHQPTKVRFAVGPSCKSAVTPIVVTPAAVSPVPALVTNLRIEINASDHSVISSLLAVVGIEFQVAVFGSQSINMRWNEPPSPGLLVSSTNLALRMREPSGICPGLEPKRSSNFRSTAEFEVPPS